MEFAEALIALLVDKGALIPDSRETGVYRAVNEHGSEVPLFTTPESDEQPKPKKQREKISVTMLDNVEWKNSIHFANTGTHAEYISAAEWWFTNMSAQYREELSRDYPGLDLAKECKTAFLWLKGHRERRRNSLNMFIRGWLRRAHSRLSWRNRDR